jgi:hypothetical protein
MLHVFALKPRGQIVRDVTRSVVAQKPRALRNGDAVEAGGCERLVFTAAACTNCYRFTTHTLHVITVLPESSNG